MPPTKVPVNAMTKGKFAEPTIIIRQSTSPAVAACGDADRGPVITVVPDPYCPS